MSARNVLSEFKICGPTTPGHIVFTSGQVGLQFSNFNKTNLRVSTKLDTLRSVLLKLPKHETTMLLVKSMQISRSTKNKQMVRRSLRLLKTPVQPTVEFLRTSTDKHTTVYFTLRSSCLLAHITGYSPRTLNQYAVCQRAAAPACDVTAEVLHA